MFTFSLQISKPIFYVWLQYFCNRHSIGAMIHTISNRRQLQCIHYRVNLAYCLDWFSVHHKQEGNWCLQMRYFYSNDDTFDMSICSISLHGVPSMRQWLKLKRCVHFFLSFRNRFNIPLDIKWSIPTVATIMCLNKYVLGQIPRWNGALIFYSATFVTNVLFVQLLLHIVPRIARKRKIKR